MKKSWIKKGIVGIIMLAIFLAPFSGGEKINEVKAETPKDILKISTAVTTAKLNNPIVIKAELNSLPSENLPIDIEQIVTFYSSYSGTSTEKYDFIKADPPADPTKKNTCKISYSYITGEGWSGNKDCSIWFNSAIAGTFNITASTSLPNGNTFTTKPISINISTDGTEPPAPDKQTETLNQETQNHYSLACGVGFWPFSSGTLGGCVASILYVLWEASAWVARLAGSFLDFFVYYSTNDTSYRNVFIEKGWGAIRDIANIFFIIALLYVAIKTILGLNVTDNKKLIGAVIIIALIINFSLFTTKVVIDGSNILAKVFYNNITSTKNNSTDVVSSTDVANGTEGEKSISVGMISKYNPQEIISEDSYNENGPGMFIFTTIILLVITLYTAYIFFSVALLFVARVVSLWIAMIFSPLAFISYAVPFEIPEFGHKKWWKNLFENAFLAPVFIFFLYIIVLFLDIGKNIAYGTTSTDPLQKIMGVVIPFVILFMLLKMAKKIAVTFSGEMGEAITKAGAVLGGLALGGAAIGAATVGRKTIGSVSKYVQNDAARTKDFKTFGDYKNWSLGKKINPFAYVGQAGKTFTAATAQGLHEIGVGKKMKEADEGYGHKTHATHILDAKMQSEFGHTYGKDAKYKDLSEHEQKIVKKEVDKDEMAKFLYGKQFKDLEAPQGADIQNAYEGRGAYVGHAKRAIANEHGETIGIQDAATPLGPGQKIKSDYFVDASKANQAMGEFVQALRKGSYDVRNLPDMSAKSKGFFPKLVVGVGAAVATGMRMGLKTSFGVNAGAPQKDFFKDIGNIISESLKSVKIDTGKGHGGGDSHPKEVKSVGH